MTLYASDTRPEHADTNPDPVHVAVLDWLTRNPHLPATYHHNNQLWTTPVAARTGQTADIRHHGGQLHIGPDNRRTTEGRTVITNLGVATFAGGIIFGQLLGDAVHKALAAGVHSHRRRTR